MTEAHAGTRDNDVEAWNAYIDRMRFVGDSPIFNGDIVENNDGSRLTLRMRLDIWLYKQELKIRLLPKRIRRCVK